MWAFLSGIGLQMRLDMRSRSLLVTCYLVPLLFFAVMGGIFSSVMPEARATLVQAMTVMGVSMGAFIGMPTLLAATYGTDVRRSYAAGGVPAWYPLAATMLTTFVHLMVMAGIIGAVAPLAFDAVPPVDPARYLASLALFTLASLAVGGVLGLAVRDQAKLTMAAQVVFLPSILLSGIMFPASMLPDVLVAVGVLFPATQGFELMCATGGEGLGSALALAVVTVVALAACAVLVRRARE